ncbi:MAG: Unknown protein [uncultured Sulfurovum sp.]|uniref:Outer membrane protein beta-barrel domain-containing protein n=1 Tax=uncultured Sulfurovum sp. TaxID=269237 RepID=A0A6S6RV65_9BACT|nr:MAG: Unknown protein [uncultured Sulfurovum sp.]
MKKTIQTLAVVSLLSTSTIIANDDIYLGLQYGGVSVKKDITDKYMGQVIVGGFGDIFAIHGRGLYKFSEEKYYNLYGYGGLSYASTEEGTRFGAEKIEVKTTGYGVSVGAGLEYNIQAYNSNLPPIYFNMELGFAMMSADAEAKYNGETFSAAEADLGGVAVNGGIHYRF